MPASAALNLLPCGEGDPAAKENESKTSDRVSHVAETSGKRDTRKPDHQTNKQGGDDVARARQQRRLRRLNLRPAPLSGDQVIGAQ
jgi:hypothetical protein